MKKWGDMTRQERSASVLRQAVKQGDLRLAMYHLPWSQIIKRAVESRPTSFGLPNGADILDWRGITEWRNAGDEIARACAEVLDELNVVKKKKQPCPQHDQGCPLPLCTCPPKNL